MTDTQTTGHEVAKLDRYKLETTFHDDTKSVVHTTYQAGLSSGQRGVAVRTTWTEKEEIGSGGFGYVTLQGDPTGKLRAVKELYRGKGQGAVDYVMELKAMSKVADREDLFVKFLGWYENRTCSYIAMEYIEHGDLSQYMISNGENVKLNAREITRQVLEGLVVLHERNICHRDLKPQNILIAHPDPVWVKIADFGASKYFKGTQLRTRIGTEGYLAPEVQGLVRCSAENRYTNAVDLWALGCIVYQMLTSLIPFTKCNTAFGTNFSGVDPEVRLPPAQVEVILLHRFCSGQIPLPVEDLQNSKASANAIAFIGSLMIPDPSSRLSASAALQTPWHLEPRSQCRYFPPLLFGFPGPGLTLIISGDRTIVFRPSTESLLAAASVGDTRTVEFLIDRGADVEEKNAHGYTSLALAVSRGHTETAAFLLNHGANVTVRNKYRDTPLSIAVVSGHLEIVKLFLAHGVYPLYKNTDEMTPLKHAIVMDRVDMVELFLNHTEVLETSIDMYGTPLIYAVSKQSILVVWFLLDRGANTEAVGGYGDTALLEAASSPNVDIVALLLERGANPYAVDKFGSTAVQVAEENGHDTVVKYLREHINAREARG